MVVILFIELYPRYLYPTFVRGWTILLKSENINDNKRIIKFSSSENQGLRPTRKLLQCTNWKVNLWICELAKADQSICFVLIHYNMQHAIGLIHYNMQSACVVKCTCYKVHMLLSACVVKCTYCKVHVFQSAHVVKCICCKVHMLQSAYRVTHKKVNLF